MSSDDLFAAGAIAVVLITVAVALAVMRRVGRNRLTRLAPAFELGTCRKVGLLGMTVEGLYRGFTCRYSIQPASQYSPGGASLRLAVSTARRWSAELASAGSRLLVKMGVLQDLEIGDPDLDSRLRFAADDGGELRSIFGAEGARTAIREILATENFTAVRLLSNRLEARWSPRVSRIDEDVDVLRQRLETTVNLAAACGYPPRLGP